MDDFISQTLDPNAFQIEDVQNDNACFFRAVANSLHLISESNNAKDIVKSMNFTRSKQVSDVYKDHSWGFEGDQQDDLARELQSIAYNWIVNNTTKKVSLTESEVGRDSGLQMTVQDLVCLTHEISFEEYSELYKYFAGDIILTNDSDQDSSSVSDNEDLDCKNNLLQERWGGYVEQVALSHYFSIPIIVVVPQRYDNKRCKTYNGVVTRNRAHKGVRFRITQIVGREFLTRDNLPIFLMWKKTSTGPHYMTVYPKDYGQVKEMQIIS